MLEFELQKLIRAEQAAALREWRKRNPDKVKAANVRYWRRRAEKKLQEATGGDIHDVQNADDVKD